MLPAFAFHRIDGALAVATAATAPHLAASSPTTRPRPRRRVGRPPRPVLRLDPAPTLDLTDEADVRRLVRTYVLPALDRAPTTPHQEP